MPDKRNNKLKGKTTKQLTEEFKALSDNNKILENRVKELEAFIGQIIKKLNSNENKSAPNYESNQNKNEHNCKQCVKTFPRKSLLKEHRTEEHPPNISCKVCGENFQERWMLEVHLKSHPELVSYSCDICNK